MKLTVLVDNKPGRELSAEWGFSAYIEHNGTKVLLDTGASGLFAENAENLGLDIADVDLGVLSHAHYDHADGMPKFFKINKKAKFYIQKNSGENCYRKARIFKKYIGIAKGTLDSYKDRICFSEGLQEIASGIYLLQHSTADLCELGMREKMYLKTGRHYKYDDFCHEQSLIFKTDSGLVIFNSCSHGGAANIINEVKEAFSNEHLRALLGGFHLFNKTEEEICNLAKLIEVTGIEEVYTGHCTGDRAFEILHRELGDRVHQFYVGLDLEF